MPQLVDRSVRDLLDRARDEGRSALSEIEALEVVRSLGIPVPSSVVVRDARAAEDIDLDPFPGESVVVKVVSPSIQHKSDVGGVSVVPKEPRRVAGCVRQMQRRFQESETTGFSVSEYVEHDTSAGGELLLGMRRTDEFGPVVTLGLGGIHAELLARNIEPGRASIIVSPHPGLAADVEARIDDKLITELVTEGLRGNPPRMPRGDLRATLDRFLQFSLAAPPEIGEFEINPLVLTSSGETALDALLTLRDQAPAAMPERPLHRLDRLLEPRSIAVAGVSERLNPGHVIVNNTLRRGFDRERLYIIKPGSSELEGCRCFPDIRSLPEPVDLLVLSVGAEQVPQLVEQAISCRRAETLIVVTAGLGERSGTSDRAARVQEAIGETRRTDWGGPLVNGGNCLGIRSVPGRYDTVFVPRHKIEAETTRAAPMALLTQSGAFAIAKLSKLPALEPKYVITVGNQIDLTLGDYLTHLEQDDEIELFACYAEGFRPMDGLKWLEAAARITATGRTVLLYRAGRSAAGRQATASHTATIAGDYEVTRELAAQAGVVVADTLEDFEDLSRLFCHLRGKRVAGWRLGAISNAGFECVAFGDRSGRFDLPDFQDSTKARLSSLLQHCGVHGIVEAHNPLDLTPIMRDEPYENAVRAVLDDDGVDVAVVGCVPHTGALNSLAAGPGHHEDVGRYDSLARRMIRLMADHPKPWVAVIDGGVQYDAMVGLLEAHGVPTFRTADRALAMFERFCRHRIAARP